MRKLIRFFGVLAGLCLCITPAQAQVLVDVDYEVSQGYGSTNGAPIHGYDDAYGVASITDANDDTGENDIFLIDTGNFRTGSQAARLGVYTLNGNNYYYFNTATRQIINEVTGPIRITWSTYRVAPQEDLRMAGWGGITSDSFLELWQMRMQPGGTIDLEHGNGKAEVAQQSLSGWYDFGLTIDLDLSTNQILSATFRAPGDVGFTEILPGPQPFKGGLVPAFLNRLSFRADGWASADTAWDSLLLVAGAPELNITANDVDDTFALSFTGAVNEVYELQYADSGDTNTWFSSGAVAVGDGGVIQMFDPTGPSTSKVYRVVQQ